MGNASAYIDCDGNQHSVGRLFIYLFLYFYLLLCSFPEVQPGWRSTENQNFPQSREQRSKGNHPGFSRSHRPEPGGAWCRATLAANSISQVCPPPRQRSETAKLWAARGHRVALRPLLAEDRGVLPQSQHLDCP